MNYKYKFVGEEIIVSEQEHNAIQEQFKNGRNIISLRGGKLLVNMSMVGLIKETEKDLPQTDEQYLTALKGETQKALEGKSFSGQYLPKEKQGLRKAVEGQKECVDCKQVHFIPDNKEKCLPCLIKSRKEIKL